MKTKDEIKTEFATRFKAECERVYQTTNQTELSKRLGISQPTISCYLNGEKYPQADNLAALAIQFGCSFEWLATGRGPRIPLNSMPENVLKAIDLLVGSSIRPAA